VTAVLIDSNVLLDTIQRDPAWYDWSSAAIERAGSAAQLVINPIIYAEVSVRFANIEDVEIALPKALFAREPLPYEAAFLAGKAFLTYRRRGGLRASPMPDFLIGAHAAVAGYRLLTRDPRRYRTYYPQLSLIAPN
jgi:predicted nucleic acid-binding protein